MTVYLQHCSNDYRIFSLEVVCHADREHLNCDNIPCMARRTVHAWIAGNKEFGKLVHKFARRIRATPHELRAIRESGEEFWSLRQSETLGAQAVVRWEVTVDLSLLAILRPKVDVSVCVDDGEFVEYTGIGCG
jgi:hypothetical protein